MFERSSSGSEIPYIANADGTGNPVPLGAYPEDWWAAPYYFTNLRLWEGAPHDDLRATMFWAIWNETSEDRFYYGGDAPIGTPDSPITNQRDQISRQFAEFLIASPYCGENGTNQALGELPWTINWDGKILNVQIEHCKDHRYMMSQVIINGFIKYERTPEKNGYTWYYADLPEELMAAAYRYGPQNLAGSLGKGTYQLWDNTQMCTSAGYFNDWPKQLKARGTDEWFTFSTYAELLDKRNLVDVQAVGTEQNPGGCGYNDECLKSFPTQAQIDALSVHWLAEYYACFSAIPLESIPDYDPFRSYIIHFQQTAPRIMTQIDAGIHDFYLRKIDPTLGGYSRVGANRPPDDEVGTISLQTYPQIPVGTASQSDIKRIYDELSGRTDPCPIHAEDIRDYVYYDPNMDHIDQLRQCYIPGGPAAILQPILRLDISDATLLTPAGYDWHSAGYVRQEGPHTNRYVDLCETYPFIRNCEEAQLLYR